MKPMKKALLTLAATALVAGNAGAWDKDRPHSDFGRLDHVFLIMMENQTNTDILNHCRQQGEHVRGCWVVDLILGKT